MVHQYTCDTLPLDNSKTYLHPALPYITWGLIWDLKNKTERDSNQNFLQIPSKSIFQIQTAKESFEVEVGKALQFTEEE